MRLKDKSGIVKVSVAQLCPVLGDLMNSWGNP